MSLFVPCFQEDWVAKCSFGTNIALFAGVVSTRYRVRSDETSWYSDLVLAPFEGYLRSNGG